MSATISPPQDAEGNFLDIISAYVEETIPTAPYANTKLAFNITRVVKDGNTEEALSTLYDEAERQLDVKRQEVLDALEGAN